MLGVVICVIAGLGCGTTKCQNPCFTLPFVILSGSIGLLVLVGGFVMIGLADSIVDDAQEQVCTLATADDSNLNPAGLYNKYVGTVMCSALCPCDPGENNLIQANWTALGEAHYAPYGRTLVPGLYESIVFSNDRNDSVKNFVQCKKRLDNNQDFIASQGAEI